ncbi:hypothetical protein GCWU000282_02038 [Catonella morbi ATCC 51271]|uniref:Uncharacterized protein n=1 Tax=Catonella morbi ATCC 51271 TaxID=592026 RepID=V2XLY1_9FIRM|nr:hypothetical protein GCWU000282_02038 [Catonella morbi ATCC 51271]
MFFSSIFIPLLYLIPILFSHLQIFHLFCTLIKSTKLLSQKQIYWGFLKTTKNPKGISGNQKRRRQKPPPDTFTL